MDLDLGRCGSGFASAHVFYSGTKFSGGSYTRGIGLDAKGHVNRIVAGWYPDEQKPTAMPDGARAV